MSKTDPPPRPMYHHTREAIESHLTVVFMALAVPRYMQTQTRASLKRIITPLKPNRSTSIPKTGY
ncbi:hypothetical protein [Enteractinococcus helveticum]|uniref:Uncharacterized protein n=1 Tax=Enteractinococcus helveticum TaxID=1837282 RepID=A0A1B7M1Y4_9MICC|nr:hypothetical protein [Enteractinococcus helveticum]OAV62606.1 hypothetical protein A6F49_05420 [Enteractinococcus helveticum]